MESGSRGRMERDKMKLGTLHGIWPAGVCRDSVTGEDRHVVLRIDETEHVDR